MALATSPEAEAQNGPIATLIGRCGSGDEQALEELYRLTAPRLFGVAVCLMRRESLAEEVLQEAFLKVWRHASDYSRELDAPLLWLTGIVRGEALDTLRGCSVRGEPEGPQPERFEKIPADPAAWPDAHAGDARPLLACLGRLEPAARDCIVRAYREGCSHDELSAAHAVPLDTVKSWIRRGLVTLGSCLDELS